MQASHALQLNHVHRQAWSRCRPCQHKAISSGRIHRKFSCHASTAHQPTLEDAKADLLDAVFTTNRGSRASNERRGVIEELQVAVERFQSTSDLDYKLLGGLWQLQYTTAADVLPILEAEQTFTNPLGIPGPVQVGNIYQRFTSPVDGAGSVDNVIQLSVPYILEEREGVTITVHASDANLNVRAAPGPLLPSLAKQHCGGKAILVTSSIEMGFNCAHCALGVTPKNLVLCPIEDNLHLA